MMTFLIRYEVNFQNGLTCGGAYLKLLSDEADSDLVLTFTRTQVAPLLVSDPCFSCFVTYG